MMNRNQAAAFVVAQAALMNGRIAGMVAENQWRASNGNSLAYAEAEFNAVEREYAGVLGHNSVIELFRSCSD